MSVRLNIRYDDATIILLVLSACNVVSMPGSGVLTIENQGHRRNCSVLMIYPEEIRFLQMDVGKSGRYPRPYRKKTASSGLVSPLQQHLDHRHHQHHHSHNHKHPHPPAYKIIRCQTIYQVALISADTLCQTIIHRLYTDYIQNHNRGWMQEQYDIMNWRGVFGNASRPMVTRGNASVWFGIRAPIHVYGPISRRALDICSIIKVAYLNFNYFKYSSFLFFSLTLTYKFALSV